MFFNDYLWISVHGFGFISLHCTGYSFLPTLLSRHVQTLSGLGYATLPSILSPEDTIKSSTTAAIYYGLFSTEPPHELHIASSISLYIKALPAVVFRDGGMNLWSPSFCVGATKVLFDDAVAMCHDLLPLQLLRRRRSCWPHPKFPQHRRPCSELFYSGFPQFYSHLHPSAPSVSLAGLNTQIYTRTFGSCSDLAVLLNLLTSGVSTDTSWTRSQ